MLERVNADTGAKVAATLARYHEEFVEPLIHRLAYLEAPWYARLGWKIAGVAQRLWPGKRAK